MESYFKYHYNLIFLYSFLIIVIFIIIYYYKNNYTFKIYSEFLILLFSNILNYIIFYFEYCVQIYYSSLILFIHSFKLIIYYLLINNLLHYSNLI